MVVVVVALLALLASEWSPILGSRLRELMA